MRIREIEAKSVLLKRKYIDSWFVSRYGMNLYRGCQHNCSYCDGRAEGYYVEGEFGRDVCVKINAAQILKRELDPSRRRKPLKGGYFFLGGGVGDSYQPVEEKYRLSRQVLEIIADFDYPVQVLTKSTLVRRDLDLLQQINRQKRAVVCFSICSVDERISRIYEPGVPSPRKRLETLRYFKTRGIPCGLFLLPVIPFVTDQPEMLEQAVRQARDVGVDYLIFGGMTLKEGRQSSHFLNTLSRHRPELLPNYKKIYRDDRWGQATGEYYRRLHKRFWEIAAKHRIALRMPPELYSDLLSENDNLVVMLEQMDYLLRLRGKSSPYGYAARAIARLEEPVSQLLPLDNQIRGISGRAGALIQEILSTGSAKEYQQLL